MTHPTKQYAGDLSPTALVVEAYDHNAEVAQHDSAIKQILELLDRATKERDEGLAREAELRAKVDKYENETDDAHDALATENSRLLGLLIDRRQRLAEAERLIEEIELACSTYKQLRPLRDKALAFLASPGCADEAKG